MLENLTLNANHEIEVTVSVTSALKILLFLCLLVDSQKVFY